jgi:hypothetical protein
VRHERLLSAITGLVFTLSLTAACYLACSTPTRSLAAPPEGARGAAKWEYCTFNDVSGGQPFKHHCFWTTAEDEVEADSWAAMAKKMKAPVKGEKPSETRCRVAVFDFLGSQGWELVSQSVVAKSDNGNTIGGLETFVFKRMR